MNKYTRFQDHSIVEQSLSKWTCLNEYLWSYLSDDNGIEISLYDRPRAHVIISKTGVFNSDSYDVWHVWILVDHTTVASYRVQQGLAQVVDKALVKLRDAVLV